MQQRQFSTSLIIRILEREKISLNQQIFRILEREKIILNEQILQKVCDSI